MHLHWSQRSMHFEPFDGMVPISGSHSLAMTDSLKQRVRVFLKSLEMPSSVGTLFDTKAVYTMHCPGALSLQALPTSCHNWGNPAGIPQSKMFRMSEMSIPIPNATVATTTRRFEFCENSLSMRDFVD